MGGIKYQRGYEKRGVDLVVVAKNALMAEALRAAHLLYGERALWLQLGDRVVALDEPVSLVVFSQEALKLYIPWEDGLKDIGIFDFHHGMPGRSLLAKSSPSVDDRYTSIGFADRDLVNATDVHAILHQVRSGVAGNPTVRGGCNALSAPFFRVFNADETGLSIQALHSLRALPKMLDFWFEMERRNGTGAVGVEFDRGGDYQKRFHVKDLPDLVGPVAARELMALWNRQGVYVDCEKSEEKLIVAMCVTPRVILRRCDSVGRHINFHTDVALRTMQIALNGDDEYEGGRLTFLTDDGQMVRPTRPALSVSVHGGDTVHVVSELQGGVRYGLFFLADRVPA